MSFRVAKSFLLWIHYNLLVNLNLVVSNAFSYVCVNTTNNVAFGKAFLVLG